LLGVKRLPSYALAAEPSCGSPDGEAATGGDMVRKLGAFVAKEVREVLPATILFLCLFHMRLLLDSRVVGLPMAYTQTFVILSSLKPLFFNSLKNELRVSDNAGA
jgi:hypothetical protein